MKDHNPQGRQYSDDTQLYKSSNADLLKVITKAAQKCIISCDFKSCLTKNKLQLNESKLNLSYLEIPLIVRK